MARFMCGEVMPMANSVRSNPCWHCPQSVPSLNLGHISRKVTCGLHWICSQYYGEVDGRVWTWGLNNIGQLGDSTTTNRTSPVQVPGLAGVVAVAAGGYHSLPSNQTAASGHGEPTGITNSVMARQRFLLAAAGAGRITRVTAVATRLWSTALPSESDRAVSGRGAKTMSGQLGDGKRRIVLFVQVPGTPLAWVAAWWRGYGHTPLPSIRWQCMGMGRQ